MKKKIKVFGVVLFSMLAAVFIVACTDVADEKKIQSDLESYTEYAFLSEGEKIDKVVIEKRQTEKEQKIDTVWCTVTTEDSEISYQKSVVLTYGLYDKEGWILDDVSVNDSRQWVQTPLKGITEEKIPSSLNGRSVVVDEEEWNIETEHIKKISIDDQETNLEEKKDKVTVTLILDSEVEEAKGELVINYKFDNGWKIDSISENKKFTATVKPEVALEITEEDLIAELVNQEFQYGETETELANGNSLIDTSTQQTITINENEISDFVIESKSSTGKGSYQKYDCTCILTKAHAVFKLAAEIQYYYSGSNGWRVQPMTITPELISVNIEGEWAGTYVSAPWSGDAVLSITRIDDDGTITGVYSYTPSTINQYSQPGSYNVSGKINMSTLVMKLTAGDWVNEDSSALSITKQDITAILCVDDSIINGLGQEGKPFTVEQ